MSVRTKISLKKPYKMLISSNNTQFSASTLQNLSPLIAVKQPLPCKSSIRASYFRSYLRFDSSYVTFIRVRLQPKQAIFCNNKR